MRENRDEFPCATIDFSADGIAISSPVMVRVGERIIAYLEQVGRLEGSVAREFDGGFVIQLKLSDAKREKLADKIELAGQPA